MSCILLLVDIHICIIKHITYNVKPITNVMIIMYYAAPSINNEIVY